MVNKIKSFVFYHSPARQKRRAAINLVLMAAHVCFNTQNHPKHFTTSFPKMHIGKQMVGVSIAALKAHYLIGGKVLDVRHIHTLQTGGNFPL